MSAVDTVWHDGLNAETIGEGVLQVDAEGEGVLQADIVFKATQQWLTRPSDQPQQQEVPSNVQLSSQLVTR